MSAMVRGDSTGPPGSRASSAANAQRPGLSQPTSDAACWLPRCPMPPRATTVGVEGPRLGALHALIALSEAVLLGLFALLDLT